MKYIVFIASNNKANSPYINGENITEIRQEWDAWKQACNSKCYCTTNNDTRIEIKNDTYNVFILNGNSWDGKKGLEGFKEFVLQHTNLNLNEGVFTSQIYIHDTDNSLSRAFCKKSVQSGNYSSQNHGEPLFKAVKKLIQSLYNNRYDEFFKHLDSLQRFACLKYLRDEIRELSFSLLLDVAGYKECEEETSVEYLAAINADDARLEELESKVSKLEAAEDNSKYEAVKNIFDAFCVQCNIILSDKGKGNIKELQKTYFELSEALEKLYER